MPLSRASILVLNDLIENRLSLMSIGDQDDLRVKLALKRAQSELGHLDELGAVGILSDFADAPKRGRRRKINLSEAS